MAYEPMHAGQIKDDPKRPWKAFVALVPGLVAMLTVLADEGENYLPAWALLLITAVLAGLLVYSKSNPKVGV